MISEVWATEKDEIRQTGSGWETRDREPKLKQYIIWSKYEKDRNGKNRWSSNGDGDCIRSGNTVWIVSTDTDIETVYIRICNYILWMQTRSSDNILIY